MFQVRHSEGENWVVVDLDDKPLFTGSYRQCEAWLDVRENVARGQARRHGKASIWKSVLRVLARLRPRKPSGEPENVRPEMERERDGLPLKKAE